jgi:plasmid stabilization system protein ParE
MARGDKSKYTDKQERKADHIAKSYEDRGVPEQEAERRAWATVNKDDRGGKRSGSGRGVGLSVTVSGFAVGGRKKGCANPQTQRRTTLRTPIATLYEHGRGPWRAHHLGCVPTIYN